jgi:two-component system NtrC family sensor kinase
MMHTRGLSEPAERDRQSSAPQGLNDRDLFEYAPVSMWLEDWSAVRVVANRWRAQGIGDVAAHASSAAGILEDLIRAVTLIDVNAAAVDTYRLRSKEELFAAYRADMNYGATAAMRAVFLQFLQAFVAGRTHAVADAVDKSGDGAEIDVRIHARLMPDGADAWRRVLLVIEDVTQLKAAEAALQETQTFKAAVLESVLDAVIVIGEDGRVLEFNAAAERIFGVRRADAIGKDMAQMVLPERHRGPHGAALARIWAGGEQSNLGRRLELAALRADGSEFPVEMALYSTTLGRRRIVTAFLQDITERKKAELELREVNERLQAAMEQLSTAERFATIGQVAATVSHEIRNPLGTISGSLALVRQLTADKDVKLERALDRIERNVERCGAVISDLLEFSGKREIDRKSVWIDAWMKETLSQLRIPADIVLDQELHATDEVELDSDRLRQAIGNLVQNAVQALKNATRHAAEGSPRRIIVRTEVAGPHVRISIADTGPGIPSDVLPRIFEPLFTTKAFGVGLGLPIARQIVEQHDGRVDVTTRARDGTTVTVLLPRRRQARAKTI